MKVIQDLITCAPQMPSKKIHIVPYDPTWPQAFKDEARSLHETLGKHCHELHHIGSTAVPGLAAKQDLDILCVVDDLASSLALKSIGYTFKDELNIPLRYYFSKNTQTSKVHLHVVEPDHGFITLNLCFRDYLRTHPTVRQEYADLKQALVSDPTSFERVDGKFPRYTLEKNAFIKKILELAGYAGITFNFSLHDAEWKAVKHLRQTYFFDAAGREDPYTWTFHHPEHVHVVMYKGTVIIGYVHLQLWPKQRAALRIMVIDKPYQRQGYGRQMLAFCERWLFTRSYRLLQTESNPAALGFYQQQGYGIMPFNDPEGLATDPRDTALGKQLC